MRTTLDLPDDVAREITRRAAAHHRTVQDVLTELLRQSLGLAPARGEAEAMRPLVETGADGLPLIRGRPGAPATDQHVDALLTLEQNVLAEEDLGRAGSPL